MEYTTRINKAVEKSLSLRRRLLGLEKQREILEMHHEGNFSAIQNDIESVEGELSRCVGFIDAYLIAEFNEQAAK